jgi:hypothetical protein
VGWIQPKMESAHHAMTAIVRSLLEEVLVGGLDDFIDAAGVMSDAGLTGITDLTVLRPLAIGLISELLFDGLVTPGDLTAQGFSPWAGSTAPALERIARVWKAEYGESFPTFGAIVWLQLTETGQERAKIADEHGWYR